MLDLAKYEEAKKKINLVDQIGEEKYLEIIGKEMSSYVEEELGDGVHILFMNEDGSVQDLESFESEAYEMLALVQAAREEWGS